jgi:uncharacterized protein YciI
VIVVVGEYHREFSRESELFQAHRDHVSGLAESGRILCSGPRDGGSVIIAYGDDVDAVRGLMEADPFHAAGVVTFTYLPFRAGVVDPTSGLAAGA